MGRFSTNTAADDSSRVDDPTAVDRRLAEHALTNVAKSMLPPAVASFMPLKLLVSSSPSVVQIAWSLVTSVTALYAMLMSRRALVRNDHSFRRLRLAIGPHLFVAPLVAVLFPQPPSSAKNLILWGTILYIGIVQLTLCSGDRQLGLSIAVLFSSPIVFFSTLHEIVLVWRILAGSFVVVAFVSIVRGLHEPLRSSIVLTLDKEQLVRDLKVANLELQKRLLIDPLTGISNRLGFDAALQSKVSQVGLLYVDVDHFKRINDSAGHAGGDAILVELAATLSKSVRPGDLVSRLGGDEFVLLLDGANDVVTSEIADRVRRSVAQNPRLGGATVSIGGTTGSLADESSDAVLQRADQNLYEAKRFGRNRVEVCDPD